NWRDFCIKGARAEQYRTHPARIRSPMKRLGDRYVPVTYETAIEEIATSLIRIRNEFGPDAIGDYLGNPGGFNVGNATFHAAFMAAICTSNSFSVGSVDQNAFHVAAEAVFGSAWFGLQMDIDATDFILLFGSNPAVSGMSWMGGAADGWRRTKAAVDR